MSVDNARGGRRFAALQAMLAPFGFRRRKAGLQARTDTPDVENLYAQPLRNGPHLMFAGHTDVVPVGDANALDCSTILS